MEPTLDGVDVLRRPTVLSTTSRALVLSVKAVLVLQARNVPEVKAPPRVLGRPSAPNDT